MIFLKENQETVYQVQVLLLTLRRPVESEMFISAQMDRDNGKAPMEINGLVYDTYWAQRRGFRRFYATSYKKYYHEVYMRIRLA